MPESRLALVTGASSGIGLELAKEFVRNDFDLVLVAEDDHVLNVADELREQGREVHAVQTDLATEAGVQTTAEQVQAVGRPLYAAAINAGIGVGGPFLETAFADEKRLIELNVTGAVHLTKLILPAMVEAGEGRLMFTSSIAGSMPAPNEAVYGASKAFLHSFAEALRLELGDSGITVTAVMPGPTDTNFFSRAGMENTLVGQQKKDDPAKVAKQAFEAMMSGREHRVVGNVLVKAQGVAAKVVPEQVLGLAHKVLARPRS